MFRDSSYDPEVGAIEEAIRNGIRISREELLTRIKAERGGDESHRIADLLLLQFVGDKEIYEAWDKLEKWFE
jgi:hypothetical protein